MIDHHWPFKWRASIALYDTPTRDGRFFVHPKTSGGLRVYTLPSPLVHSPDGKIIGQTTDAWIDGPYLMARGYCAPPIESWVPVPEFDDYDQQTVDLPGGEFHVLTDPRFRRVTANKPGTWPWNEKQHLHLWQR